MVLALFELKENKDLYLNELSCHDGCQVNCSDQDFGCVENEILAYY